MRTGLLLHHERPMANSMNRFSYPAIGYWLKHSPRKFTTTMLKVNFSKPVVANDWPAVPVAKNLVFAFNGIKAWWKTGLVVFHRADLAKTHSETSWCIPAYRMTTSPHIRCGSHPSGSRGRKPALMRSSSAAGVHDRYWE